MYVCMHVHIYIYTHNYTCINICIYIYIYVCICIQTFIATVITFNTIIMGLEAAALCYVIHTSGLLLLPTITTMYVYIYI